ncbi:hypothetical protein [Maridesulfovibrio ferrireducens]|uniref:hypothetical protein n=1 Tax=Maridesulfovibrio ferrireducens TaxID=246191 RepID=UPI001A28398D|nr:hypothetical protein [Maridesulfovibrio ferrireducens]MBI9113253.1 hypothetical protein [Maridesulfovibrio ferrireducens]
MKDIAFCGLMAFFFWLLLSPPTKAQLETTERVTKDFLEAAKAQEQNCSLKDEVEELRARVEKLEEGK